MNHQRDEIDRAIRGLQRSVVTAKGSVVAVACELKDVVLPNLTYNLGRLERLMATLDDLNNEITALAQKEADFIAREDATKAALQATIDDLKAQIAAGNTQDFSTQVAALVAIEQSIPGSTPAAPPAQS